MVLTLDTLDTVVACQTHISDQHCRRADHDCKRKEPDYYIVLMTGKQDEGSALVIRIS